MVKPKATEVNEDHRERRAKRGPGNINAVEGEPQSWKGALKDKSVDQRWNFVKEKRLCFRCLSDQHIGKNCNRDRRCEVNGCKRRHHPLLHQDNRVEPSQKPEVSPKEPDVSEMAVISGRSTSSKPLSIVPVIVSGPYRSVKTYALMDTGANTTVIQRALRTS